MLLFDNIERTFVGSAGYNENTFDYYQRSARKDIAIIRAKLNDWFQSYPENEKHNLKGSFRDHFDDCFYELFLFQLFRKLDFQIEIHPKIPNSSKKPDFLIKRNELEVYVEAKIVKSKSRKQEALERKINQFYDDFNKIKIKGFLLDIHKFIIKTGNQPSTKQAIGHIEKEINKIEPELLTAKFKKFGCESIPSIKFEDDSLEIIVKPIPIKTSAKAKEYLRSIGIFPIETFWGGGEEPLRDSINYKAKRYGKFDKPFIICVNSLDIRTSGKSDVDDAIWGSLAISWSDNPNEYNKKLTRKKNGIFLNDEGPRLKNLSGVFVTKVYPHNIPNADYWFYKNPFSSNKLDFNKLGLAYNYVENGKIIDVTGNDLDKILKIPKKWLAS